MCEQKLSTELCHNRTDSTLSSDDQHGGENNRHRKSLVFFGRLAGSHLRVRFRSKHETVIVPSSPLPKACETYDTSETSLMLIKSSGAGPPMNKQFPSRPGAVAGLCKTPLGQNTASRTDKQGPCDEVKGHKH